MSDLEAALRAQLADVLERFFNYGSDLDSAVSAVFPVVESFLVSCRSGRDAERAERLAEQERIRALADDLFRTAWRASHEPAYSRLASETGAKIRAVLDKP